MAIQLVKKPLEIPVYRFGSTVVDGDASMKALLGGKGANLAEMAKLGVRVPPGFTIPTNICLKYLAVKDDIDKYDTFIAELKKALKRGIDFIHADKGSEFLVSVRSGARVSMPGMMDTILNVGLDQGTYPLWSSKLGKKCADNCFERLAHMYGDVVYGYKKGEYSINSLPDAEEQLLGAVLAVFKSWENPRAVEYRKIHNIPESWGTAVTVQSMVFGNMNEKSATGVLFSRDPSTGEQKVTGEFLVNAQGEDVVAGIATPEPLGKMEAWNQEAFDSLMATVHKLENHYRDMQDIEFTVEDGKLYLLQTRNGKRAAKAAFRIAKDLVESGMITKEEAASRITPAQLKAAMEDKIDKSFTQEPHLVGIAAGGSVVSGVAVFSSVDAVNCKEPCILITKETSPDDIAGMNAAVGILTSTGGLTSHAAVVARGMNKACVVGATTLWVDEGGSACTNNGNGVSIFSGTKVTIDGSTGEVWIGVDVPINKGGITPDMLEVISWATGNEDRPVVVYLDYGMSATQMSETIKAHGRKVYIETAPFIVGGGFNGILHDPIDRLHSALLSAPDVSAIINFTPYGSYLSPQDHVYTSLFEDDGSSYAKHAEVIATYINEWGSGVLERLTFSGEVPSTLSTSGKVKSVVNVTCVADLFKANGPISASKYVIDTVFGGDVYFDKMVKLMEEVEGKDLSGSVSTGYHWYDFLTGDNDAADANP